jgi:hypothetical protein
MIPFNRFSQSHVLNLRLSSRPVMALELGSHPKPTQIAGALVYVGGISMVTCPALNRRLSSFPINRFAQICCSIRKGSENLAHIALT